MYIIPLPKPSACLREFLSASKFGDSFGPNLGPIGAVIYVRQGKGFSGMLAWSGSESMFDALDGISPGCREVTPYIDLFERAGL
jgi:hypothetical protein